MNIECLIFRAFEAVRVHGACRISYLDFLHSCQSSLSLHFLADCCNPHSLSRSLETQRIPMLLISTEAYAIFYLTAPD